MTDTPSHPAQPMPGTGDAPGTKLLTVAEHARTLAALLRDLDAAQRTAVAAAPATIPDPHEQITYAGPLGGQNLAGLAVNVEAWAGHLAVLADRADNILRSAASYLLQHADAVAARETENDEHWLETRSADLRYQASMRSALGGLHGDHAAAVGTPTVVRHLADLLTAVDEGAQPETLRGIAAALARAYLDARANDDHRPR